MVSPLCHQQPKVNYLPRFSSQLISLERYMLSVYRAGEIDLFENLDIVHIRLLVVSVDVLPTVQWYLAHTKMPTHLGPPHNPRHRPTVGS